MDKNKAEYGRLLDEQSRLEAEISWAGRREDVLAAAKTKHAEIERLMDSFTTDECRALKEAGICRWRGEYVP